MDDNSLSIAKNVFETEIEGLKTAEKALDEKFLKIADAIDNCKGHIIMMGVGKSGHICRKIVATMQSLGIKAFFMHPSEGLHGDLGCLSPNDIVIGVSNSGETDELLRTIPSIKHIGAKLFAITGRSDCTLVRQSELDIALDGLEEVFLDGMVPTTSTTATLVLGDALAVTIASHRKFTKNEFGIYHPNGTLGKRLTLKISDMVLAENTFIGPEATLEETIMQMCGSSMGGICIVDHEKHIIGVFTDGDLRRQMNTRNENTLSQKIAELMKKDPLVLNADALAYDEIERVVKNHPVSFYPVVKDGKYIGSIRAIDFIRGGLM